MSQSVKLWIHPRVNCSHTKDDVIFFFDPFVRLMVEQKSSSTLPFRQMVNVLKLTKLMVPYESKWKESLPSYYGDPSFSLTTTLSFLTESLILLCSWHQKPVISNLIMILFVCYIIMTMPPEVWGGGDLFVCVIGHEPVGLVGTIFGE